MKETINSLRIIFSYVARPPGGHKNSCWTLVVQKICKTRKKTPLEPLDLLAMVGQSCVCVCVFVSVSVCVLWRTTLRCRDVEVSEKNTYLSVLISFSLSSTNYYISIYHTINWNLNIYSVQLSPRINNNTKNNSTMSNQWQNNSKS